MTQTATKTTTRKAVKFTVTVPVEGVETVVKASRVRTRNGDNLIYADIDGTMTLVGTVEGHAGTYRLTQRYADGSTKVVAHRYYGGIAEVARVLAEGRFHEAEYLRQNDGKTPEQVGAERRAAKEAAAAAKAARIPNAMQDAGLPYEATTAMQMNSMLSTAAGTVTLIATVEDGDEFRTFMGFHSADKAEAVSLHALTLKNVKSITAMKAAF